MTYFGFLAIFLGIPIALLITTALRDARRGKTLPAAFGNFAAWGVIALHVVIAVIWTTPWDNYLVATRVWWYDPALVTGLTLGYVPIEEYTFFVVQPIMTGLWLALLMRYLPQREATAPRPRLRRGVTLAAGVLWLGSAALLFSGWRPGTYLGLELVWALAPIILQLGFGADILWRHRRLVLLAIIPTTLYLSAADALAIQSGTWTIDPEQSLQWYLGGVLPVEEFIFFLLTNTLITFGMTLALAAESRQRVPFLFRRAASRQPVMDAQQSR
jgi:lycopene cyclase domain-containing protein